MKKPFVSKLFKKLASKAGVKINLEPEWGYVGQIVAKNGRFISSGYFTKEG